MQLEKLRELVRKQYLEKNSGRDSWADWLYERHVLWVADKTSELCARFGGDKEIAVAGALVHDIADSVMERKNKEHEEKSLEIGRQLCEEAGYSAEQIAIIIDDIAQKHSCHDGIVPESLEGKIVATADACAHFETEFYLYAFAHGSGFGDYNWMMHWMSKKLERDFYQKILFEEVKQEIEPQYKVLSNIVNFEH